MIYKIISLICSSLILLFLLLHDWINIYPFNDLKTLDKHCSLRNKILMTLINAPFFIIYMGILLHHWSTPFSFHAKWYLVTCNCLFSIGILFSWWLPYLFGWPQGQVEDLGQSYSSTHRFLPPIVNNPIPDTMHVIFHVIFIINLIATLMIL
jgi:hypothetical protein